VTLLAVEALSLAARSGNLVLDRVSFDVAAGEIMALVGESGSGKTMAARAAIGLPPPGIRQVGGVLRFDGVDLATLDPAAMRRLRGAAIGLVFQEPMVSLNPALTIGAQMIEALTAHAPMPAEAARAQVIDMLGRVRIADPASALAAHPHRFSGGMRQRIMLASVMLPRPKLLLADEPTTALDTLTQRDVLDLMVELATTSGTAVLLITHNLGLVARYAQRVVVMRRGVVVERGAVDSVLRSPTEDYTRELIAALPRRRPPAPPRPEREAVIAAEKLSIAYPGKARWLGRGPPTRVVDQVDLTIHAGEAVALVGGSGSGKTTLGRAMLGLIPVAGGRLLYRGADLAGASAEVRRRFRLDCQLVFQDPQSSLDPRQRVLDIVMEPLDHEPGLDRAGRKARALATLDEVGLADFADRLPHALSGGQRQRVAIARAIVRRPALVVADEPVSALDMTIQKQVLTLFRRLQERVGFACLFISHDLAAVAEVADRVLVMEAGRIVEQGTVDAVFDRPAHPYTRALLAAAPSLAVRF
jgi:peptide/nickel transport system ATP-binding protein